MGGWVGGWAVGRIEEAQAVRMRCCGLWMGGWVGRWMYHSASFSLFYPPTHPPTHPPTQAWALLLGLEVEMINLPTLYTDMCIRQEGEGKTEEGVRDNIFDTIER